MAGTDINKGAIMEQNFDTITVNGVKYAPIDSVQQTATAVDGMPYMIVRGHSAGVFAGYVKSKNGDEVELVRARRLWYWRGAASLSQLAVDGVKFPDECKFPCEANHVVLGVCEMITATEVARKIIQGVKVWRK